MNIFALRQAQGETEDNLASFVIVRSCYARRSMKFPGSKFVRSLFWWTLCRRSLRWIELDSIRVQLLSNRNHRFGDPIVRIGPAILLYPILQFVDGDSPDGVKGVHDVEIVRGHKSRHPMLHNFVGDFVLFRGEVLQALFRKLNVIAAGPGPEPKG